MICGEKTTTQQAIEIDLSLVSQEPHPAMGQTSRVPANAAQCLDVKIGRLRRRKHVYSMAMYYKE